MSLTEPLAAPMDSSAKSWDLFDGDIFGDELVDVYCNNSGDGTHDFPEFLPGATLEDDEEPAPAKVGTKRDTPSIGVIANAPTSPVKRSKQETLPVVGSSSSIPLRGSPISAPPPIINPATQASLPVPTKPIAKATRSSNMVLNVRNNKRKGKAATKAAADTSAKTVDKKEDYISTAQILALTGKNWASALSVMSGDNIPQSGSSKPADNRGASSGEAGSGEEDETNLTADERLRQKHRDRNRVHARNTRLRKKAHVEMLKRTMLQLVERRDAEKAAEELEKRRELEQREVRFRVAEEFLKLRGRNDVNITRWAAILDENIVFTLPATNFYPAVKKTSSENSLEQVLNGVPEIMADASNFSLFLQGIGRGSSNGAAAGTVTFQYRCERQNFFMDGCNAVLEWSGTSVDASNRQGGAHPELAMKGIFRGTYCPASNKLLSASISFDTGSVLKQTPQSLFTKIQKTTTEVVRVVTADAKRNQTINDIPLESSSLPMVVADATQRQAKQ